MKNKVKAYSIIGTLISSIFTVLLVTEILAQVPTGMAVFVGILTSSLLEAGYWIFDSQVPQAKSNEQANLYKGMMVFLFLIMAFTSVGYGISSAIQSGLETSDFWIGVSIVAVSVLGNIAVLAYTWDRYLDPDIRHEIEKNKQDIEDRQQFLETYAQERAKARHERARKMVEDQLAKDGITRIPPGYSPPETRTTHANGHSPKVSNRQ